MDKTRVTHGMWRIDPQKRSRVMDRFGKKVASAEAETDASLIAAAPDMYDVLEKLENHQGEFSEELLQEIQLVLRRARGDFGLAVFSNSFQKRRLTNKDWLKFMEGLWNPPFKSEP
jgi:hypothetical protein